MPFHHLGIIGLGLLGGSVARAARARLPACHIAACERSDDARRFAEREGLVDAIVPAENVAAVCREADCILFCTPPDAIELLLQSLRGEIPAGAVISDVASVKGGIVRTAARLLQRPEQFVGGHPMAGGERSGVEAARASLFEGATVILTPTAQTAPDVTAAMEQFWTALGASPVRRSPEQHDREMAIISHLPHLLASALVHLSDADCRAVAGNGFHDLTRIAAGDAALWRQILSSNNAELQCRIDTLITSLRTVGEWLEEGRTEELEKWLAAAAAIRRDPQN